MERCEGGKSLFQTPFYLHFIRKHSILRSRNIEEDYGGLNVTGYVEMDFFVHYYEVNYYKEATSWTILNYLQETAFLHSHEAGDTQEMMGEEKVTWMIYKWFLKINRYPRWKERVRVRTWISQMKSYKAFREFEVYDTSDRIIASASALCILIDTEKNSFKKIGGSRKDSYVLIPERATDFDFANFSLIENETTMRRNFSVRISDIDSNGHVNNAKYLDWFIEDIPFETLVSSQLHTLEIIYKKQVTYGNDVAVLSAETTGADAQESREFTGEIRDAENKTCAIMRGWFVKTER